MANKAEPQPAAQITIHDEEWLCHAADDGQGHLFELLGEDLDTLKEAVIHELYGVS